jgi:hypothetical protein
MPECSGRGSDCGSHREILDNVFAFVGGKALNCQEDLVDSLANGERLADQENPGIGSPAATRA